LLPRARRPFRLEQAKSSADLLAAFDKNIQEARAALASAGDERWLGKWSLLRGGETIMTLRARR